MAPEWLPGGVWAALGRRLRFGRLPGGPLAGSWGGLGAVLAALGGRLGASWGAPGASWAAPGAHFGFPGASFWSFLSLREAILEHREATWGP